MGDRTWTSIRFSGKITQAVAEELIEQLNAQGCSCDEGPEGKLTIEHLKLDQYFYDGECDYGQMEGVEDLCHEHGIAYLKTWEPGGGYGPGNKLFTGTEDIECGTIDGEPALTLREIKQHGTGFMAFLDSLDFTKYPPLEIVG
jgi:hypothetical protein